MRTARIWPAWGLVLPLAFGCGEGHPPTYPAGGTVTFPDGKLLSGGWVEFQPIEAPQAVSARGAIEPDGTFRLGTFSPDDGALEGRHRVLVVPPTPAVDIDAVEEIPEVIDPRYRRFETSGLQFVVTRDPARNRFAITVERPPTP